MIDSFSPLHPPNFANHSSRTSCLRTPLCFSSLSMFRRPSPPAVPYVRYKGAVPPFSCPSFRPDGLRNLPCPARIQPRICCSCARFRLFLFNFHPVLASIVRCSIRMVIRPSGTWLVSRRCEWVRAWFPPVARRRMVVWCLWGTMEMGIEKAPSRFDLTLLCDSFSCTICPLWVEIVLAYC